MIEVRRELLQSVSALASPSTRAVAAQTLATKFGAERLLLFVRDDEVGAMLAAPGFSQSMPNGKAWREFLEACVAQGEHTADLPVAHVGDRRPVAGYSSGTDIVLALVGTSAPSSDVEWFRSLLPMFGAIFRGERSAAAALSKERIARDSAARASMLAKSLDRTRRQLEDALTEASSARAQLEGVNSRLNEQAAELEVINEQLRDQAEEMEQQAAEMEAQAAEMEIQSAELKATNDQLLAAREVADSANHAKTDFLATMSHELRTPLNAIGGHVQLIEMGVHGPINAAQRDALGRIDRSQRHLLGLINNILNLSRIEAGRVEYDLTDVSLAEVLTDLAPMIEPQFRAKSMVYECRGLSTFLTARADRDKLQQILLNLLSNAVKFTDPGGTIRVESADRADASGKVFLRVIDTGMGIPAEKLDSIFEPFTQVDSSHSRAGQGTGLGLAISRDLARGMGGDLRVRSELGSGSAFTLTLQAASTGYASAPQSSDASAST